MKTKDHNIPYFTEKYGSTIDLNEPHDNTRYAEFEMAKRDYIPHAKIANQVALHFNEQLKGSQYYKKELKAKLNLALKELYKLENDFDALLEDKEDSTVKVHDVYYDFISEVASVPIWKCEHLTDIIKAYKKDSGRILGVAKKILDK